MKETKKCPKDGGSMEEGEMYAFVSRFGCLPLWWGITDVQKFEQEIPLSQMKESRKIIKCRCTKCGYIENYATDLY